MKAFKYLVFLILISIKSQSFASGYDYFYQGQKVGSSLSQACEGIASILRSSGVTHVVVDMNDPGVTEGSGGYECRMTQWNISNGNWSFSGTKVVNNDPDPEPEPEPEKCEAGIVPITLKVPVTSGKMVCVNSCQYSLTKCVDVDFEAGMTCDGVNEGRECGTPPPTTTPTTPPVTQDPTNPTDKTDEQKTFENIMHVIGEKLDGIKDAITGGNQNQDGDDTGGSTGGNTGGDVNVDMSETNAKIDETNSLIDELTKWLQGEDLGDDIFGDSEPPEKELTPQQFDTNIFSGSAQCPADARLNFKLLGGKSFTKTFEFKDWCDNLEIFGSLILIASYLFGAYIIVSKS